MWLLDHGVTIIHTIVQPGCVTIPRVASRYYGLLTEISSTGKLRECDLVVLAIDSLEYLYC